MLADGERWKLIEGDCLDVLRAMPAGCVDAVVTDPPYGLEFMGKEWDAFAPKRTHYHLERADTRKNISDDDSKPASRHHVAYKLGHPVFHRCRLCDKRKFSGSPCRCDNPEWIEEVPEGTPTRAAAFQSFNAAWAAAALHALKPAGYMLAFGGSRTYHRLACAVEDAGFEIRDCIMWLYGTGFPKGKGCLKPAYEPVLLCRKPGPKVAPLGIDECRVGTETRVDPRCGLKTASVALGGGWQQDATPKPCNGRWPANVVHDGSEDVLGAFAEFGEKGGGFGSKNRAEGNGVYGKFSGATKGKVVGLGDAGTAARFFYTAKASRSERGDGNTHPTVKPLALMRWLVRLVCPPGGLVLDPFLGSGTTALAALAEGRRCIGVERDAAYCAIARRRLQEAEAKERATA
jgi:DNA modification methylase